jgi:hypothetical protein
MATIPSNRTPNEQLALDTIRRRKQAYVHTFREDDRFNQDVLADLARFCRANTSTFDVNPRVEGLLQGRKEVWQRIAEHLGMTESELYDRFVKGVK